MGLRCARDRPDQDSQADRQRGEPEIHIPDRKYGLKPINTDRAGDQQDFSTPGIGCEPGNRDRWQRKNQDMEEIHVTSRRISLKALVDPLRRLSGGEDDDCDQDQAQQ